MSDPLWINQGKDASVGTATIATDGTFTITSHGLADGDTVTVDTLTGGASGVLVADGVYFVRDSAASTFKVSTSRNGAPVTLGSSGGADVYRFAPQYDAQELRRAFAGLLTRAGQADGFGARAGVLAAGGAAGYVSLVGSTWTTDDLVVVVYPGLSSQSGAYLVAHPSESGALNPPDGTNPRIDAIDLQVQDDDEDASGFRRARIVLVDGTPGAVPVAPAVTANAVRIQTFTVPQSGGGDPSLLDGPLITTATGGIIPVRDDGELPPAGLRWEGLTAWHITDQALRVNLASSSVYAPVASTNAPQAVVFTTSGTFDKADYPWAHRARVKVVGGGGSGGGAPATGVGQGAEGGGGAGGGYAEGWLLLTDLASSVTVTVGAGGAAASAGAAGNAGGSSSFGAHLTATGGEAGAAGTGSATSSSNGGNGGAGGGTDADLTVAGDDGGQGRVISGEVLKTATGGGTVLASRVCSRLASSAGDAGAQYGGGSSGASNAASQAARASTAGAAGVVVVELY